MSDENQKPDETKILIDYESPWDAVVPNGNGQDAFITANGVLFKHFKAIPCIIGQVDEGGIRHSHQHDDDVSSDLHCENSYLYMFAGYVWGVFSGNQKQLQNLAPGYVGNSTAIITFNRYYKGTQKLASFTEYDKLFPVENPKEFFHSNFERMQHNPVGLDKPQFKVTELEYLYDSYGHFYTEGKDFKINTKGQVEWLTGSNAKRPGYDPISNTPKIIALRYKYAPYFYVRQMLHEVRIVPQFDPYTGNIIQKKMPMQAMVQVDWLFLSNTRKDKEDSETEEIQDGQPR